MATGRRRRRHRLRHAGRPRLGPGGPVRPGARRGRQELHPSGQLPLRRRPVRPRILRYLAARGPLHGPAAATAPGDVLGGPGACGHRPGLAQGQPHRRVRRSDVPRLRPQRVALRHSRRQCRVRPAVVHVRLGRPGRHRRHRLLVLPRRPAPRGPGAALGRVLARGGRRCHGDVHAGHVRRVQPTARPVRGRPLQGVRGRGRRRRLVRGRRRPPRRAPLRRRTQRAPRPRGRPGHRRQPGRRLQRFHRPQRALAAARHPAGARGSRRGRLRGRRRRGPRYGHDPGRPDRGAGAARHLRSGPSGRPAAAARLHQVEHRARPGRRRCRRRHQDGDGHGTRLRAAHPARRPALTARRLDRGQGGTGCRGAAVAGRRTPAPCECLRIRTQRHQRARRPGTGPRTRPGRQAATRGRRRHRTPDAPAAVDRVRRDHRVAARPGRTTAHPSHGPPGPGPAGHRLRTGHLPHRAGVPRRRTRCRP
ncbi:hypothetical protein APS67_006742 [Streptomyces sp. AVP053U2]|nr:hypothetical protein APS67_006742 [Streptomyces sp. AVP053U2]